MPEANKQTLCKTPDEHVLVCLTHDPENAVLIQAAAKLASLLNATFTSLYVRGVVFASLSEEEKRSLQKNRLLAESLGANIEIVSGEDSAYQVIETSKLLKVTHIFLSRNTLSQLGAFGSVDAITRRIVSELPYVEIHLIPNTALGTPRRFRPFATEHHSSRSEKIRDLVIVLSFLVIATIICAAMDTGGISEGNMIPVYIIGVLLVSLSTTHWTSSFVYTALAILAFNFLFSEPRLSLSPFDHSFPVTLTIMAIASVISALITSQFQRHTSQASQSAFRSQILFDNNHALQKVSTEKDVISTLCTQIQKLMSADVIFYPNAGLQKQFDMDKMIPFPLIAKQPISPLIYDVEKEAIGWSMEHGQEAGSSTTNFPDCRFIYFPCRSQSGVYGVAGIELNGRYLEGLDRAVIRSMIAEGALALDNLVKNRRIHEAELKEQSDQLRAKILRAIGHDLRTPLTVISGSASNMMNMINGADPEAMRKTGKEIYENSLRMSSLVENLLTASKLEDGQISVHPHPEMICDLIEVLISDPAMNHPDHPVTIECDNDLLMANVDSSMAMRVLNNLMTNAIQHTPPGTEITIHTYSKDGFSCLDVADTGNGMDDESKDKVFDIFYTGEAPSDSTRSLGLGLFLCKKIAQAHGGDLLVRDNHPKGLVFTFQMPPADLSALHQ